MNRYFKSDLFSELVEPIRKTGLNDSFNESVRAVLESTTHLRVTANRTHAKSLDRTPFLRTCSFPNDFYKNVKTRKNPLFRRLKCIQFY